MDDGGAVRDLCRSRALETALALRLLQQTGQRPDRQEPCIRFLRSRHSGDPVDGMLARVALSDVAGSPDALAGSLLDRAPAFTRERKHALLVALLSLWDGSLAQPPGPADLTGLHSWARVQVTAVKVVLAMTAGCPHLVDDEDVRLLLSTQRVPGVWEGNVFIHLWVLHALKLLPGTADVIAEGTRKFLSHQRPDGGLPFVTDLDTWCTATAGVALFSAGAPAAVLRPLAGHLAARQQPAGGWSYTDLSDQTDVDNTSVAVEFLHLLDAVHYAGPIRRGTSSLLSVRGTDGGFPTYIAMAPAEPYATAAVLDALTLDIGAHEETIRAGLAFLAEQQRGDGSFPPDWSSSRLHTLFRVLLASSRVPRSLTGPARRMRRRALDLILGSQEPDGGWGGQDRAPSDPISTAYALIALCCQDDPAPAVRGVTYLLSRQRSDGRIEYEPDSIGPRPFIFSLPALGDIFALLALGHLTTRISKCSAKAGESTDS
ncbi:prenyltransferase/squalene oxidase repeat-containing protein [Actinomadura rubrisoli]|uniref:prenyltransferase/squalene oxidase repeat-containing protein n=1 Tax=Actinomadura rubrisoli TaxID=2530368 RepID=UPI0014049277|nr:prenyltransferase/squalene oxidase repeat-containing protein [Actinomadura rubrisoli]